MNRLESYPELTPEDLLQAAQEQLDVLLKRNLDRDPRLRELYERRFGKR